MTEKCIPVKHKSESLKRVQVNRSQSYATLIFLSLSIFSNTVVPFSWVFTTVKCWLLALLFLPFLPASGLDKQESLSVISTVFVCLNERQGKDREGTHTRSAV